MTVLVMEDDPQWSHVIAAMARMGSSADVTISHTFRQGWQRLVGQPFDVVLLDLTLGDSTPDETIGAILQMKSISAKRVIIVTASHLAPTLLSRCMAAGADDAISKDCATIQQCLADALAGRSVVGAC